MKINYYFKNVDEIIEKQNINATKNNDIITFMIDDDVFKLDIRNNILRKENNDSLLLLKFTKNKTESGSYYIKELLSSFDAKIKTYYIDKKDKFSVKYKMWLDEDLIGDFEMKIDFKEE